MQRICAGLFTCGVASMHSAQLRFDYRIPLRSLVRRLVDGAVVDRSTPSGERFLDLLFEYRIGASKAVADLLDLNRDSDQEVAVSGGRHSPKSARQAQLDLAALRVRPELLEYADRRVQPG